ncbi:glycoside hydrolase family 43 protein [Winogradskyella aurantiaca]|uniref:glycoside hydrolase family 43 protein n=1 Tax=Winogradskyella aurantiaca TaxID=2219558 RepID=UPI000E1C8136|nr:glycoside hydrolase family 43 protein [Winogradskyella aurantiaca]
MLSFFLNSTIRYSTLFALLFSLPIIAQQTFLNPILRGSHPDPSICRVDSTYYIVNSTFEYFPGLPIHKSTDLINWELIGYGLHRKSQTSRAVNLKDVQSDGGIHAPTIRYHNGLFYIITTNVYYHEDTQITDFVNFIITAENPAGPWSDPHVIDGAPGIDPDIFFDDDERVWYVGTHAPENPNFEGEGEIWLQELDLNSWQLIGERFFLWRGACGGVWAEGPHMYKYDNLYYVMIAEGGTSFNHAVTIAISEKINGPYISNERNPIFTTRHLSYDNWVHSTGHGDLFQTHDGEWYLVALGIRGDEKRASNMGRESFLVPVVWEQEPFEWKAKKYYWPVIAPISGKIERNENTPFVNTNQSLENEFKDDFKNPKLNLEWCFRRVPNNNWYKLDSNQGVLRITGSHIPIANRKQTSLMGFRQKESDFEYRSKLSFNPSNVGSKAGISLYQKDDNYINFLLRKTSASTLTLVIEIASEGKVVVLNAENPITNYQGIIEFKVISMNGQYEFLYRLNDKIAFKKFHSMKANIILSKGYTGAYLGLYCHSPNIDSSDFMEVDWVHADWMVRD